MVQQWRQLIDSYNAAQEGDTRILLTESTYATIADSINYYEHPFLRNPRAHFPFNLHLVEKLDRESTAFEFKTEIDVWMNSMPFGATANWIVSDGAKLIKLKKIIFFSIAWKSRQSKVCISLWNRESRRYADAFADTARSCCDL
jgi:hypothetical protein